MGIKQWAVNGMESLPNILRSNLFNYLGAAGATDARVVVTIGGRHVEYPLPQPTADA